MAVSSSIGSNLFDICIGFVLNLIIKNFFLIKLEYVKKKYKKYIYANYNLN